MKIMKLAAKIDVTKQGVDMYKKYVIKINT